jgi:Glycosyl transferase family 2
MKVHFITLALDAMPHIAHHINQFNQLRGIDWDWSVIEGVAKPVKDTGWVKDIPPRLSADGTTEYLSELETYHPRVSHYTRLEWPGKTAMLNYAIQFLKGDGLLFQIDSDELWQAGQLYSVIELFKKNPTFMWAEFFCRYLLGANIEAITPNAYGNNPGEWKRCWRWKEWQPFVAHEPPILSGVDYASTPGFDRHLTRLHGLTFWHPAYASEKQLAFKEKYYGYTDALEQWKALQAAPKPCRVGDYLKWVTNDAMCDWVVKV